jgi:hypothetical protein
MPAKATKKKVTKKKVTKKGKVTNSKLSEWSAKIQEEAAKLKKEKGIPHRTAITEASAALKKSGFFEK